MNHPETVRQLDEESLRVFARKGLEDQRDLPQTGNANAVKVRRILQLIKDLAIRPMTDFRVLDLACGEGVYSIEIGLRGANVLGLDARTERMHLGAECAHRNGLTNVSFKQEDIRNVKLGTHGEFDVILFLGILYHLDMPDSCLVLKNLYDMCRNFVIIDTHVSLGGPHSATFQGNVYHGRKQREHQDTDTEAERRKNLLQSLDNIFSFWFTPESLVRLLADIGFTSVVQCFVPMEPHKPRNRITLVAFKGKPVQISSYPWLNGLSEEQINQQLRPTRTRKSIKTRLQHSANALLRPLGLELRPISV